MKWIIGIIFMVLAAGFYLITFAGDNVDAKALSGIMMIPAIICLLIGIIALGIAWLI